MTGLERARSQSRNSTLRAPGILTACLTLIALLAPVRSHAQGAGSDSLSLAWSAPGDDGAVGTATSYEVRRANTPLTNANFGTGTLVANPPGPLPAGTRQRMVVRGVTRGTPYYFAVRAQDAAGNVSSVSNSVYWDWGLDAAPPAAPSGAAAQVQAEGRSVTITWRPNTEADLAGYHVYRAAVVSGPWSRITNAPVTAAQYTDAAIPVDATDLIYQLSAVDALGNESARSSSIRVTVKSTSTVAPLTWKLLPAYPNPSRLSEVTRLPIEVPASAKEAHVDLVDGGNQLVRRFEVTGASFGVTEIVWDGTNANGRPCAPGVYRAWLIAGDVRQLVRIARVP